MPMMANAMLLTSAEAGGPRLRDDECRRDKAERGRQQARTEAADAAEIRTAGTK